MKLDDSDRRILTMMQQDAELSLDQLADGAGLSRNAVWRRVRALTDSGVIRGKVALADAQKLGVPLTVFVQIRTDQHTPEWSLKLKTTAAAMPQIMGVYRMSGDLDYLIKAQVADVQDYDKLYRKLIDALALSDVSASFVMEEIKETTALPV